MGPSPALYTLAIHRIDADECHEEEGRSNKKLDQRLSLAASIFVFGHHCTGVVTPARIVIHFVFFFVGVRHFLSLAFYSKNNAKDS